MLDGREVRSWHRKDCRQQAVKQLSRVSPGRQAGRQVGGGDGHTGLGIVSHAWSARLLSPYH